MARVCMLVTSELDRDPRVQKEAKIAHEYGYDVTVICRSYKAITWPYQVRALNTKRRASRIGKYAERLWSNIKMARLAVACRPDIIHANDLDTLPAGYLASKLCKARLLYDAHELWSEAADSIGSTGRRAALVVEQYLSKRADAVVTVSHYRARCMTEMLEIPLPAVVMNTPYYVSPECLAPGAWVRQFGNKRIILHQGRYVQDRGLPEAIMAARYLSEGVVLVFRGYGPIEDRLRDLVREQALSDRVFFLPAVPMNELVHSAVGADIGLVLYNPSNKNNLYAAPNKMFEFMMAGVPCVGSDLPYVRDILCGLGVGAVFAPSSAEEMARVVNELVSDPDRLDMMKKRCFEHARQFAWEMEGAKLVQEYVRLLANDR